MKPLLQLKNVVFRVPSLTNPILKNVSLDIYEEDFIVLLGHNGSGKSSLIKMINKSENLSSGKMFIENQDYAFLSHSQVNQRVSTLTQDLSQSTFSKLTVYENCKLASSGPLIKEEELKKHLILFHPKLANMLHKDVEYLSGGEKQSLALAMCFLTKPKVLLLDEHTSALDPKISQKLIDLTVKFIKKEKITTVMTTHSLKQAINCGNRLIALKEGNIIFQAEGKKKNSLKQDQLLKLCFS
jgi:putative tryptophan/tyrosine transport system ATP-binding protein